MVHGATPRRIARALGGQAGVTERIVNCPSFPDGVKGSKLADRLDAQARRYGVELLSAVGVTSVERDGDDLELRLGDGQRICVHAALIVTGSSHRRLNVPGEAKLIGSGVHFCAACDGPFYRGADELLVVGGGNCSKAGLPSCSLPPRGTLFHPWL